MTKIEQVSNSIVFCLFGEMRGLRNFLCEWVSMYMIIGVRSQAAKWVKKCTNEWEEIGGGRDAVKRKTLNWIWIVIVARAFPVIFWVKYMPFLPSHMWITDTDTEPETASVMMVRGSMIIITGVTRIILCYLGQSTGSEVSSLIYSFLFELSIVVLSFLFSEIILLLLSVSRRFLLN